MISTFLSLQLLQVYWFKDGKQISKKNEHYRMSREGDGTCALHIEATTNDDDGNYTFMAANPQVGVCFLLYRALCTIRNNILFFTIKQTGLLLGRTQLSWQQKRKKKKCLQVESSPIS